MKHSLHALIFAVLLSASLLQAQTCEQRVAQGRAFLSASNLAGANEQFQMALAQCPNDPAANFFHAFTRLAALVNEPSGSNFLNRLGLSPAGRNVLNWQSDIARDTNGSLTGPFEANASESISILHSNVLPAVAASEANLALITQTNFLLTLSPSETRSETVLVDYGDVQMLRSMLYAAECLARALSNWNLDVQLSALHALATNNLLSIQTVLAEYPQLLTFSSTNQMAAARNALQMALDRYLAASTLIRSRPAGTPRLFTLDEESADDEARFRGTLENMRASLDHPVVLCTDTNYTLDVSRFFSGNVSPRDLLPDFAGNALVLGTFSDATMGGILEGLTPQKAEAWVARHFQTVTRLRQIGLAKNAFIAEFPSLAGNAYALEYTSNLVQWVEVAQFFGQGTPLSFTAPDPTGSAFAFYRVVNLGKFETLSGKVIDRCSRAPIAGATLSIPGRADPIFTDAQGYFSFPVILSDYPMDLVLSASGFEDGRISVWESGTDLSFSLHPLSTPAPANDNYLDRISLTGLPARASGTTCGATPNVEDPWSAQDYQTVWYSWTAPSSCKVIFRINSGSFSHGVLVFTGNPIAEMFSQADGSYEVVAGQQHFIVITDYSQSGAFELLIAPAPSLVIDKPAPDAEFVAPADIPIEITVSGMEGTVQEVVIGRWTDGWVFEEIVTLTNPPYHYVWSNAPEGIHTLTVIAHDSLGNEIEAELDIWVQSGNDHFSNRREIPSLPAFIQGTTAESEVQPEEPSIFADFAGFGGVVWWSWTAQSNGPVAIQASLNFPEWAYSPWSMLAVFTGDSVTNLALIATNAVTLDPLYTQLFFAAQKGRTYQIALATSEGIDFTLDLSSGVPPQVSLTLPVNGTNLKVAATNVVAVAQASHPNQPIARVEFYLITQSDWETKVSLVGSITNPPYRLNFSLLYPGAHQFQAVAIDQAGFRAYSAKPALRLTVPNDNFQNATPVSGEQIKVEGSNAGATVQIGEEFEFEHSIWWSWTAPRSGIAHVLARQIDSSEGDLSLAVYSGTSLTSLSAVARTSAYGKLTAGAIFQAQAGQKYHIAVDRWITGPVGLEIQYASPAEQAVTPALDGANLSWNTLSSQAWRAQNSMTHDGNDAARSASIGNSQSSWLQTTVTGPGTLRFWWKVSSEESFDYLSFLVDGCDEMSISGSTNWRQETFELGPGQHLIVWEYAKDEMESAGSDCGWLDEVSFQPLGLK